MKVISVTPVGKKRYLEILVQYLLNNRRYIYEHHFWLDNKDPEIIKYVYTLAKKYPDFFKINQKERLIDSGEWHGYSIWQYFRDYTDENCIYLRLDEDICYIAEDAIPNIISYRIKNPKPFLVFGNIVNHIVCSYIHQRSGAITFSKDLVDLWGNGWVASQVHKDFLSSVKHGDLARWKFESTTLDTYPWFSVNVFCWYGKDMRNVKELSIKELRGYHLTKPFSDKTEEVRDEERFLSIFLPARFGRPNAICGDALFCHFSFYPQRAYLENSTISLEKYYDIAFNKKGYINAAKRIMLLASKKVNPSQIFHVLIHRDPRIFQSLKLFRDFFILRWSKLRKKSKR